MFAIYDIEGLRFRDTLEKLHRVQQVPATDRLQLHSNVVDDETQSAPGSLGTKAAMTVSSQARQAYKDMLHLNQREPIVHALQLMSHPVTTISMEIDILDALRNFQQLKFKQMPVINTRHQLVGLLTIENLLQFIIIDGDRVQYLKGKQVADAMSPQVITADPIADIRRVARLMHEYHLHGVPIVDEQDNLLGIVSRSDILRAVTNEPPLNLWS
jgi:acetoin utilization protein AcuB